MKHSFCQHFLGSGCCPGYQTQHQRTKHTCCCLLANAFIFTARFGQPSPVPWLDFAFARTQPQQNHFTWVPSCKKKRPSRQRPTWLTQTKDSSLSRSLSDQASELSLGNEHLHAGTSTRNAGLGTWPWLPFPVPPNGLARPGTLATCAPGGNSSVELPLFGKNNFWEVSKGRH